MEIDKVFERNIYGFFLQVSCVGLQKERGALMRNLHIINDAIGLRFQGYGLQY